MNLKQLEYFLTIAGEGQITAAAEKLHMAQPPLSSQLKLLEDELGVRLVERKPRGIELTAAGILLKKRAEQIKSLVELTENEVSNYGKDMCGTLSIGAISSSAGIMPDKKTVAFSKAYPGVRFSVHEGNTYEVLEMLDKGIAELGIVRTPFQHRMLNYRYAPEEPMMAVMPENSKTGTLDDSIELHELLNVPLIIYRRFDALINEAFAKADAQPYIICKCDDARTAVRWAKAGFGTALVPKSALLLSEFQGLAAKTLKCPELVTRMAIIWMKNRYVSNIGKKFIECFTREE